MMREGNLPLTRKRQIATSRTRKSVKPDETITTSIRSEKLSGDSNACDTRDCVEYQRLIDDYVCIPINKADKKACVSWKSITESPEFDKFTNRNIGILTGERNSLIVVDLDHPKTDETGNGIQKMQKLLDKYNDGKELQVPTCITQSGGIHLYFAHDSDFRTTTHINDYSIDIRANGGYVVAPPSVGEIGGYVWKDDLSLHDVELRPAPEWLKTWLLKSRVKAEKKVTKTPKLSETSKPSETIKSASSFEYLIDADEIKEILDELPPEHCNDFSKWFLVTAALKSANLREVWDVWSKTSTSYDEAGNLAIWNSLVPKVDLSYLSTVSGKKIPRTKYEPDFTLKPDLVIDDEYVKYGKIIGRKALPKCIVIKSPCGTGKTTVTRDIVHKARTQNPNARFLSITCRKSLAFEHHRSFGKRGVKKLTLDLYSRLSAGAMNGAINLAIQLDSLLKIDSIKWKGSIIYLDEIASLFNYLLTSSTLNSNRRAIMNSLIRILLGASVIICTDADLNDASVTFLQRLNLDPYVVVNKHKGDENMAYRYKDPDVMIRRLERSIRENAEGKFDSKIFACFDTKKQMEEVVQRLKTFCEENNYDDQKQLFRVYSSEEGDKDDLLDVMKKWKDNHVFFTPCITVGVDFNHVVSREVYLFSQSCSVNSKILVQMVRRCRNASSLHFYVRPKYSFCPMTIESVKEYYVELASTYTSALELDEDNDLHKQSGNLERIAQMHGSGIIVTDECTGEVIEGTTAFADLYFANAYYDRLCRSATREQFEYMLRQNSFSIKDGVGDVGSVNDTKSDKQRNEAARTTLKARRVAVVKRALSDDASSLTKEEKHVKSEIEARAFVLGIDTKRKTQMAKYKRFIETEKGFESAIAYKTLKLSEVEIKRKITEGSSGSFGLSTLKSVFTRVNLIVRLQKLLDVKSLDLDSQRDYHKFGEEINMEETLREAIIKSFRIRRNKEGVCKNNYGFWYVQLCFMYRNILSDDLITNVRIRNGGDRITHYSISPIIEKTYSDMHQVDDID